MGRWSQRRLAGGGVTPLNEIITAHISAPTKIDLTYSAAISASSISGGNFVSNPSSEQDISILQLGTRSVRLTMSGNIEADTTIDWTGATPGVLTPQTVDYT